MFQLIFVHALAHLADRFSQIWQIFNCLDESHRHAITSFTFNKLSVHVNLHFPLNSLSKECTYKLQRMHLQVAIQNVRVCVLVCVMLAIKSITSH